MRNPIIDVSGFSFVRYGLRSGQADARAFLLMGCGALMATGGLVSFGVVGLVTELPPFGVLDIWFLGAYGCYLAGMIYMPAVTRHWRSRARILIDSLVAAISVLVLVWTTVLEPLAAALSELPVTQRLIGSAYPVLDTAMITGVMVLFLRRSSHRFDRRLLVLSIGFGFQAIADMTYLTRSAGASFEEVELPLTALLAAAFASVVAAALVRSTPAPTVVTDRSVPLWSYVLPYTLGVSVVGYHLYLSITDRPESLLLEVSVVILMGLVIARQSLATRSGRTRSR